MVLKNKNISDYIKQFTDDASNSLRPFVAQSKLNTEFISGKQNKRINRKSLAVEDKNFDQKIYTEKKIFNRILPIYLTRYGILSQNMPIPGIVPESSSSKEVSDSLKINGFVRNFLTESNFKKLYQKAIKHADVSGLQWFKTGIDWSAGDEIASVEVTVEGVKGVQILKEGKPFISTVPIHEVFVDNLYVEHIDEVNELVHRRAFPVEYILKRWGFKAEKENVVETKLPTFPRYSSLGISNAGDVEYAYVYEYYKRPDAMYPKGRYVITCNDSVLWDSVLPYENGSNSKRKIPFDCVALQNVPNNLIGVTVYQQIIPIQETYNTMKNRYNEYVNHLAIGQLYYWEGSLTNPNNFTTRPGKLIKLKRNGRIPQTVSKERLTNEFMPFLNDLKEDMLVTAGLSEMSAHGLTKSNVRTDGVADKISESDDNKLVNALDNISETLINVFKKLVYLEQQRQDELYEKLKIAEVKDYTSRYDLKDVDPEKITIVNRDFLMRSDQFIENKVQQAAGLGMYAPDSQMSYGAKIELLNTLKSNFLKDTLDPIERATYDLCLEENAELLEGTTFPQPESYHVHAQHIVEHNLFRISPEVRKLKRENPKKYEAFQQAIDMHIDAHQEMMQETESQDVYNNAKASMDTVGDDQGLN